MQLCGGSSNLALFEVCYSSLLHGMLYRSTIYVLAPINLKVQFFGCLQKFLKKTFVHCYSFIVAITSIRPKLLIPSWNPQGHLYNLAISQGRRVEIFCLVWVLCQPLIRSVGKDCSVFLTIQ